MNEAANLNSLAKAIAHEDWRTDAEKTESLIQQWKQTKAALKAAQDAHLQSEINFYNAVKASLPDKGTFHVGDITIVTGYTEKWSQEKLTEIYKGSEKSYVFRALGGLIGISTNHFSSDGSRTISASNAFISSGFSLTPLL